MATMSPISQKSVVEIIIDRFQEALLNGELKAGQKLPSEQELIAQLSVGRGSVREAMKMLAAMGAIEIRHGDGTYVASAASPALLDPLVLSILIQSGTSQELLELREMIEIGYCELAAVKATNEDLARLEASLEAWKEYASSSEVDSQRLAELDLQFHYDIIEAARNPLVARISRTVEKLFFATIHRSLQASGGFERALEGHKAILSALKNRDPMEVRSAVHASLEHWYWHLQEH